jgi:hypothetical protein
LCWIDAVGYQITLVIEEKIEAIEDPSLADKAAQG